MFESIGTVLECWIITPDARERQPREFHWGIDSHWDQLAAIYSYVPSYIRFVTRVPWKFMKPRFNCSRDQDMHPMLCTNNSAVSFSAGTSAHRHCWGFGFGRGAPGLGGTWGGATSVLGLFHFWCRLLCVWITCPLRGGVSMLDCGRFLICVCFPSGDASWRRRSRGGSMGNFRNRNRRGFTRKI